MDILRHAVEGEIVYRLLRYDQLIKPLTKLLEERTRQTL
jgi:hypothetical protein